MLQRAEPMRWSALLRLQQSQIGEDEEMLQTVLQLIEQTATYLEIVAMCGHAMYIGRKGDRT